MWERVEIDAEIMGRGKRPSRNKAKEASEEFVSLRFWRY